MMTAGMLTSDDAYRMGLVNCVPQVELLDFCNGIAQKIIKKLPVAISSAIKSINANYKDGEMALKLK
jgi:enoyl-CoA hydratase